MLRFDQPLLPRRGNDAPYWSKMDDADGVMKKMILFEHLFRPRIFSESYAENISFLPALFH